MTGFCLIIIILAAAFYAGCSESPDDILVKSTLMNELNLHKHSKGCLIGLTLGMKEDDVYSFIKNKKSARETQHYFVINLFEDSFSPIEIRFVPQFLDSLLYSVSCLIFTKELERIFDHVSALVENKYGKAAVINETQDKETINKIWLKEEFGVELSLYKVNGYINLISYRIANSIRSSSDPD